MKGAPPKLIIVDQSLRDFDGHHYEYDFSLAAAAKARGLDTSVLAHRAFSETEDFPSPILGWFSETAYQANRGALARLVFAALRPLPPAFRQSMIGLIAGTRRSLGMRSLHEAPRPLPAFGQRLADAMGSLDLRPDDHVLIHTVFNGEFHALLSVLPTCPTMPHVHLVLRRDADEPDVKKDPWGGLAAIATALGALPEAVAARLHLYADTEALAAQYRAAFAPMPVGLVPIPHCLGDRPSAGDAVAGPVTLVYLGNARGEKGFHLLADMVDALSERYFDSGAVRLVAQSNIPESLNEGAIIAARARLAARPDAEVRLLGEPLSVAAFQDLLFSADIVLLPYEAAAYRRRSSGILVQAAVTGKPVVVPADTWLADAAPEGTAVTFATPAAFTEAVRTAIERVEALSTAARGSAPDVARTHNAAGLIETLLETAARAVGTPSQPAA